MALRNAFENLGTESTLRRILNMLTFARDSNDRLRTIVDNQPPVVLNMRSNTTQMNGNTELWYSAGSWNITDAREDLRIQHNQRADFVKRNRWTY